MSRLPPVDPMRAGAPRGAAAWTAREVTYRYPGSGRTTLRGITVEVPETSCTGLLGPNGSGKSTLLRILLGTLTPDAGAVEFGGRPLSRWRRRDLARLVGVVSQHEEIAFPVTVRELVAMGRYPHLGLFAPESRADREAIERALERCDVASLRHRLFTTLSGGERQRVRLARALAQEPRVLALDEPTLALDIRHEMEIFELLRELLREGVTVLIVTHHLNLAARYCDRLLLLDEGRLAASGPPGEILRLPLLEEVYRWPLLATRFQGPGPDAGSIQITPLAASPRDRRPPAAAGLEPTPAPPASHPLPETRDAQRP